MFVVRGGCFLGFWLSLFTMLCMPGWGMLYIIMILLVTPSFMSSYMFCFMTGFSTS